MRSVILSLKAFFTTGCMCDECCAIAAAENYLGYLRLINKDGAAEKSLQYLNMFLVKKK